MLKRYSCLILILVTLKKGRDSDIIIITKTDKRFFDRYDDFNAIYNIINYQCDVLMYTPS